MKVLFVLDTYYPQYDGPASVVKNLATIMTQKQLAQADLVVPHYPKYVDNEVFNVCRCPSIMGPDKYRIPMPGLSGKVRKLIKNGNYDVVHIHSPFSLGKYVSKLAKKYNIPIVTTLHTDYKSDFERKLKTKFLQNFMMKYIFKVMNMADVVCTVSNGAGKKMKEYGFKKDLKVIGNATDIVDNVDLSKQIKHLQKQHHLKGKTVFLFVGRVVENKNIQYSLNVLKALKEKNDNFVFLIIGKGNYVEKLKKMVSEFGLEDNVIFVGFVEHTMLLAYYKCADMFLFPSTFDTCGLVVLEAGCLGTPSLLLKDSCASELVQDGVNGFVIEDDYIKWRDKILDIISKKELLKQVSENCAKTLGVSWDKIVDEYVELYKKVISKHKTKTRKTSKKVKIQSVN